MRIIHSLIEHDQVIPHHFRREFAMAVFVIPTAGAQSSFDIYQAAFVEIFLCQFGKTSP
jgi:hypothetical protein